MWCIYGRCAGFVGRLKAFYFETTAQTASAGTSEAVKGSRLTIDAARREDDGLYICTAQNTYGSDTSNVQLIVVEPPEPPTSIMLDGVGSRTLTLSWKVEFDGNSPLTAVVIELCNDTGQPIRLYARFVLVRPVVLLSEPIRRK